MPSGEPVELARQAFARWADRDYERLQEFLLATSTADGITFRARESGVDMDVPWGWVFELRDGKLGQMHFYASAREALEAAELGG